MRRRSSSRRSIRATVVSTTTMLVLAACGSGSDRSSGPSVTDYLNDLRPSTTNAPQTPGSTDAPQIRGSAGAQTPSPAGAPEATEDARGTVSRHVDGDTIAIDIDESVPVSVPLEEEESTRLIGVDTPETVHPTIEVECFGPEASAFLAEELPIGTEVILEFDQDPRDRYDRLLAYVTRAEDGLFMNAELIARGYATPLEIKPNTTFAAEFRELAAVAQDQRQGLWAACPGAGLDR